MDLLTEHLTLAEDPRHTIRVVVADGHQLVREGVKRVVAVDPGIVVVGESADLAATLEVVAATRPDVLLLDLSLSGTHELDALRAVTGRFAGMPVLVLSSHSEAQFGIAALRLGAAGYLCKSLAADVIVKAIRKAHAGGRYLRDTLAELLAELLAEKLTSPHPRHPHELLTEREHDVLRLLALGSPVKQVAGKLDISISSVNTYRGRMFTKLRIKSNAELIRYAMRHRLVS
jgi:DNA-binding NarL/FixJ family response regulator